MKAIRWWAPETGDAERELLLEVLESNFLNDGEYTTRFESELALRLGCNYAVAVTSGTAALFLALAGLSIGHGDEVIVPDVTFIASANAVRLAGATPVLVDVDPRRLTIDPAAVQEAISARTRAIMPVHVSGRAADMPALGEIADQYGLFIVEDAAEALMSKRYGRYLGTFGKAGCVSFSPNKTITTGQGGAILTDDADLHVRIRELKDQGRPVRGTGGDDVHHRVGYNFKLTNLQAAIGLGQLRRLDARVNRLRAIYRQYAESLGDLESLVFPGFALEEGEAPQWVDVLVDRPDELISFLEDRGVECRRFWFPLHTQAPYRQADELFPVSTRVLPKAMWLPSAFGLDDSDIALVCDAVRQYFAK